MAAVSQQRWLPAAFRRTPPARSGRRRLVGRGMPLTDAIGPILTIAAHGPV